MLRRIAIVCLAVLYLLWFATMTWYLRPRSPADPRPGDLLIEPRQHVALWGGVAFAGLWCLTLALLIISARRLPRPSFLNGVLVVSGQLALVAVPAASLSAVCLLTYNLCSHPWTDVLAIPAPGGHAYHIRRRADTDLFTRELDRDRLFVRSRVVASMQALDDDAAIVRPAGVAAFRLKRTEDDPTPPTRAALSRDGRWLLWIGTQMDATRLPAVWEGCSAYFAYDLRTGGLHAHERLRRLSPFLLIGRRDSFEPNDLGHLLIETQIAQPEGRRVLRVVLSDASHPNAAVRRAVALMLREYWDGPDVATAKEALATMASADPDPGVRRVASHALGLFRASIWRKQRVYDDSPDPELNP